MISESESDTQIPYPFSRIIDHSCYMPIECESFGEGCIWTNGCVKLSLSFKTTI